MNKKGISIIMATYNAEKTVSESINSIISQTYEDWEFIICDDCSTDKTYEILLEFEKQYPTKIIVIRNAQNYKLAYSLNHCLKYARSEYIARMDADDISFPERLEIQMKFIQMHKEYDVVGTAMVPFDESGERAPMRKKKEPNKFDLLTSPCFNHATILMKKSVYDALGGYIVLPRTTRTEDYDLWFRFFAAGYKGYNLQEPLYKVRESVQDLRRRTFIRRLQATQTALFGYHLLHYPLKYYILTFKPIIAGLIPKKVMYAYHKRKFIKLNRKTEI